MKPLEIDREILEALLQDGRKSFNRLAQELGVSTTTVSVHITDLIERGILKGYKVVLDWAKLGYEVTAITRVVAPSTQVREVLRFLTELENLTHIYLETGNTIVCLGKWPTLEEMKATLAQINSHPAVADAQLNIALEVAKENGNLPLREKGEGSA